MNPFKRYLNMKACNLISKMTVIALAFSCSAEEGNMTVEEPVAGEMVTINASIADLSTKLSFTPVYDNYKPQSMTLTWAEGDQLRIYDHDDRSQFSDFDLAPGSVGSKTGTFTGTLVSASSYDVEVKNAEFDYADQKQASDGATTDLKYLAAAGGLADVSSIVFTEFSSILALTAKMPSTEVASKIKSVDITASADIFAGGNALAVTLDSAGDAGEDGILHFFATLPQGDQEISAGTTLLVKFNAPGDAHDVYTRFITLGAQTFTNNKLNTININASGSAVYANASSASIGESSNPYLIGDKYQMQAMRDFLKAEARTYFEMVDDVDLDGVDWVPVATGGDDNIRIDFDGGGHTIYNLTVDAVNGAAASSDYAGFLSFLWGEVHDVIFDGANIEGGAKYSGTVAGYIGVSGNAGICNNVTVRNARISASSNAGGIGGRVRKGGAFSNCHVINTQITNNGSVGGLFGLFDSNGGGSMTNCSADRITVTGSSHYGGGLVGIISTSGVIITGCHTSGIVKTSGSGRHFGGLVGSVQGSRIKILNCYSTCTVNSYLWGGGLIGSIWSGDEIEVNHCFASGDVTFNKGLGGAAGLSGAVQVSGATISNCIAWNGTVKPFQYALGNYSSGAVVGYTHPNCVLIENYRNPDMSLTAYWVPSADYDHPNVNGTTSPLVRIGTDLDESKAAATDLRAFDSDHGRWAYHGKHCDDGTVVVPDETLGWTSEDISGDADPEADPSWSDTPTVSLPGAATVVLREGVEWTTFHGLWEGEIRNINIVRTRLDGNNHLGIYYNYTDEGFKFLDEKCEYVGAIAGTNGPMACCHFVRVDDVVMRPARAVDNAESANCALTIDGDDINIVKVADNYAAAVLPNRTVGCAGPLLVWKGYVQSYAAEETLEFLSSTHPRTAIGISKDGKTVVQVTVDGRWDASAGPERAIGMSTALLSKLMKELGCYKAMNFDGGGGTAMWISGKGNSRNIVNHPSDNRWDWNGTGLRATGNAVYVK